MKTTIFLVFLSSVSACYASLGEDEEYDLFSGPTVAEIEILKAAREKQAMSRDLEMKAAEQKWREKLMQPITLKPSAVADLYAVVNSLYAAILAEGRTSIMGKDFNQINARLLKKAKSGPMGGNTSKLQGVIDLLDASNIRYSGCRKIDSDKVFQMTATLIYELVRNHVYENANKRTATVAGLLFLKLSDLEFSPENLIELINKINIFADEDVDALTPQASIDELSDWIALKFSK